MESTTSSESVGAEIERFVYEVLSAKNRTDVLSRIRNRKNAEAIRALTTRLRTNEKGEPHKPVSTAELLARAIMWKVGSAITGEQRESEPQGTMQQAMPTPWFAITSPHINNHLINHISQDREKLEAFRESALPHLLSAKKNFEIALAELRDKKTLDEKTKMKLFAGILFAIGISSPAVIGLINNYQEPKDILKAIALSATAGTIIHSIMFAGNKREKELEALIERIEKIEKACSQYGSKSKRA